MNSLACPICYSPLVSGSPDETKDTRCTGKLLCLQHCRKSYAPNEAYLDLTVSSGCKAYAEVPPLFSELFRTPLVSFLYERGWRQNFVLGGFPGPEKSYPFKICLQFEMAKEYLKPTVGGTIIDASCGSGLFSRLFAKSRLYSLVVALDFSENMLRQCNDFVNQEGLPRDSVDAVHAGAALHCWPSPSAAVSEISRVLRPGGVFVATTFILDGIFSMFHCVQIFKNLRWVPY
ncbi:unnamed protein product [Spirodela intermedia]|uniref:Methyltransferase type 11 domain-containing protein n=1 Tax=Spirodela intermedia TaxID=51605 RepID=A0A7I8INH6_SPIIN|nr:unnamed protein product [Spirodela intermedia]CAA6659505.1 unnamed protein product [Spirodela intermedia]